MTLTLDQETFCENIKISLLQADPVIFSIDFDFLDINKELINLESSNFSNLTLGEYLYNLENFNKMNGLSISVEKTKHFSGIIKSSQIIFDFSNS